VALQIKSTVFEQGEIIPKKYSCDGENVSPPLNWSDIPKGTKSFALILDDPDAPAKIWVHWIIYNIPADQRSLDEYIPDGERLANGALHGTNDYQKFGYRGPCPPGGTHRYSFKIYALDSMLNILPGLSKQKLLSAMKGHVIEQGKLIGRYARQK